MANLLKYGDVLPHRPPGGLAALLQCAGIAQQDGHAQLVVQETALDVAALGDGGAGVKADDVAVFDAQGVDLGLGEDHLVQQNLHGIPAALGLGVVAVHMHRGIGQLAHAGVDLSVPGVDAHVLGLGVVGVHAAQSGKPQPAVGLHAAHHAAQSIQMGLLQNAVAGHGTVARAQLHQHAALAGDLGLIAQGLVFLHQIIHRVFGKTAGAVDGQHRFYLMEHIFLIVHLVFPPDDICL